MSFHTTSESPASSGTVSRGHSLSPFTSLYLTYPIP
nr:MAG TPA: hypothetical protein [Caudoviricetes sp.]